MRKKSQAALEFLSTYGWVILVVIAAVIALSYFGVLNPKTLPKKCTIEAGIGCLDFKVHEDSIILVLKNARGEDINVETISIGDCTGAGSGFLKNGEQAQFIITGCDNTQAEAFREDITLTYSGETGLGHTAIGSIRGRVEEDGAQEEEPGEGEEEEMLDIPSGTQRYFFRSNPSSPQLLEAIIDPLDVHVGDVQTMTVKARDKSYPITFVTAYVETDTGVKPYQLSLIEGTASRGTWQASWTVVDTHSRKYNTEFVAKNSNGETTSVTLTWDDPCTPPPGGAWTLDGNCGISGNHGVANGDATIADYTLTVNDGGVFVWNPGESIIITTGSIGIAEGGQLRQSYLWMKDSDVDGYPAETTMYVEDTAPESNPDLYKLRHLMSTYSSTDCTDTNAYVFQNVDNMITDVDQDGYTTGTSSTMCVGETTVIEGITYYKNSTGNFSFIASNEALGTDTYDDNSSTYQNLDCYDDIDLDTYGAGSSSSVPSNGTCPPGYSGTNNDCDDNNNAIHPGTGVPCPSCPVDDDVACGTIDCSGWYVQSGTESATATETCYNKVDFTTGRCEDYNDCKDANTADCSGQSNDASQYTCGTCKYIAASACTETTQGSCSNYADGTGCGTSSYCDGSGNCAAYMVATGGTITTDGDYKVHTFTSSGTFTVTQLGDIGTVEYLVIGGGGGGGGLDVRSDEQGYGGGGGGGGGYRTASGFAVSEQGYTITVGGGGSGGVPNSGGSTQGSSSVFSSITSTGGGYGGDGGYSHGSCEAGGSGGSGGGGSGESGGGGSTSYGNNGGAGGTYLTSAGGGGGGAGGAGGIGSPVGGTGGSGLASSITGSSVTRGGGGGGGDKAGTGGTAGSGGGGVGANDCDYPGNGEPNTGGGGGGGGSAASKCGGSGPCGRPGGSGGSGVVIIRYQFQP